MSKHRIRVRIGLDDTGKPLHTFVRADSQDELNDRIVKAYVESRRIWEFIDRNELQSAPSREKVPFKAYAENWLETFKTRNLSGTTISGYRSYLRQHLYPEFGEVNIYDISVNDIQLFLNDMDHLSKQMIKEVWGVLKRVLDCAVEDRIIEWNQARSKRLFNPSNKVTVRDALPLNIIQDIIFAVADLEVADRRLMALLLFTGMRRGEVLGLQWGDLDFDKKLIHVQRACTYENNQATIRPPKTNNGVRDIPLDAQLELLLQPTTDQSGFIIGGESPISMTQYRNTYERIKKTVPLNDATAHVFRHSYLSLLAKAKVAPKIISAIAGHGDIKITMNRYVHEDDADIVAAGEAFHATIDTFESVAEIMKVKQCTVGASGD